MGNGKRIEIPQCSQCEQHSTAQMCSEHRGLVCNLRAKFDSMIDPEIRLEGKSNRNMIKSTLKSKHIEDFVSKWSKTKELSSFVFSAH